MSDAVAVATYSAVLFISGGLVGCALGYAWGRSRRMP
jgi:hypothetical protein